MTTPRLLSNRYELGDTLGYGGMSEVHKGRDVRLGRDVAIKVLRADLARDATFQERFRREAQNAAALNHPAIVAVYDTGETRTDYGPLPYIVMEYVDGRTLRDIVKSEGPLSGQRAMEIMADVCAALDFSHRHGIIHRDVKPANVMITKTGAVKVMDFGIARALADGQAAVTQTAAVIGTAQYLSPEQARGEGVDARSDVYASGCVLFELLTGEPPFTGDSPVAVAYQHVREDPKPPSTLNSQVSPVLDAIVLKAMAKGPANRYQSAAEMRTDLVRVLSGQRPAAPMVMSEAMRTSIMAAGRGTERNGGRHRPEALTDDYDDYDDYDQEDEDRRRKRKAWLVGALVAALLIGAGVLVYLLANAGGDKGDPNLVAVPNVVGYRDVDARNTLTKDGFKFNQETVECGVSTPDKPAECSTEQVGFVIATTPGAGEKINKFQTSVTLRVGKAPGEVDVPDLRTKSRADADAALKAVGLQLGPDLDKVEDDANIDKVSKQSPEAHTSAKKGSQVRIALGKPVETVEVPDVVNQTKDQATKTLKGKGFQVATKDVDSDKPAGTVVSQDPTGYTKAKKGSTVTISVSKGPQQFTMPSLKDLTKAEAENKLKALGWTGTFSETPKYTSDSDRIGKINAQNPSAGETVSKDQTIMIEVWQQRGGTTTTTWTVPCPPNCG